MNLVIRELGLELVDDYLAFFDRDAFGDNPHWSHCYCAFYHRDYPDEWPYPPQLRRENRAFKAELIKAGQAPGLLAYADGRVVGWCNAGPRSGYQNLRHRAEAVEDPSEPVGSTLCFIVARDYRGQGVASALLKSACDRFKREGVAIAEGYPNDPLPRAPLRHADERPELPRSALDVPQGGVHRAPRDRQLGRGAQAPRLVVHFMNTVAFGRPCGRIASFLVAHVPLRVRSAPRASR